MSWQQFFAGYSKNGFLVKYDFKSTPNPDLLAECLLKENNIKHQWLKEMCQQYLHTSPKITYKPLLGPISINYLTSKDYPHRILILGDMHTKDRMCKSPGVPVDTFIHDLIAQTHHFIDIFLEVPYYYQRKDDQNYYSDSSFKNSYLTQTMKAFRGCNNRIQEKCHLERCRVHFADIRSYLTPEEYDFIYGEAIYKKCRNLSDLADYLYSVPNIRYELIQKQIKAIPNKKIQKELLKAFDECIELDFEVLSESIANQDFNSDINRDIKSRGLKPYMDTYLLARIFRCFKKRDDQYSECAYNSVVYVGDQHAQFYVKVLRKIGFQLEYASESQPNECLIVSNIKKKFFD